MADSQPPLALVAELEHRLGRWLTESELSRAEAAIDDASALVRDVAGRTWIDRNTGLVADVPSAVATVVVQAAERVMRNPRALQTESLGDYSYRRSKVRPTYSSPTTSSTSSAAP